MSLTKIFIIRILTINNIYTRNTNIKIIYDHFQIKNERKKN